jgi:hypothetical protein
LHACMVTTGDKQLYGALVAEARSVLRDLRRRVEIVRAARPGARRYRAA